MGTIGSSRAAAFARRMTLVLATGYTLFFFSEVVFWSDPGRVPPVEAVTTWLAYSLLAFVLLGLVTRFHVRNIWGVFLAGAVVGWLAEGVVVHTVFETCPFRSRSQVSRGTHRSAFWSVGTWSGRHCAKPKLVDS